MMEPFVALDEVAAVVAVEEDICDEAIALINITYTPLPFLLHAEQALATGAPVLRGDTNEVHTPTITKRGDVTAGRAAADVTIGPYTYESMTMFENTVARQHAGIESEVSCSSWDGNRLTFWADTQTMHPDVKTVAAAMGLPYNKVYFPWTGTGYRGGGKGERGKSKLITSFLAMQLGVPVKAMADSERHFSVSGCHQVQNLTISSGAKKDGTLTFIEHMDVCDGGNNSGASANGQTILQKLFVCPNLLLTARDFTLNTNTAGSPRCVQHPRCTLPTAIHFDRMAEALNMNPADFLLKNIFTGSGTGKDQDNPAVEMGSNPMPGMLQDLIAHSGWTTKWKGWKTPMAVNGVKATGIGISIHQCSHGGVGSPATAVITARDDGTFIVDNGSGEFGQGMSQVTILMAAEELGVTVDKVGFATIDTDSMAEGKSCFGSGGTRSEGGAIILAARDLKQQLFALAIAAGKIKATDVTQLETTNNNIYLVSDPTQTVAIKDVTALAGSQYMDAPAGGILIGRGSHNTKGTSSMQWGCAVVEVEVDTDTGEWKVLNAFQEHDAGRVIFGSGALSMLQGGVIECLGRAGMEGIVRDQATGLVLNGNYLDYKIPTHADLPQNIDITMNEGIEPFGPFGAKGMAEPICNAPANAFANAIYNACGARVYNTPITPEKILVAMGKG
jgi:CO/xanthine dehydrogenase Mo-binding subunit